MIERLRIHPYRCACYRLASLGFRGRAMGVEGEVVVRMVTHRDRPVGTRARGALLVVIVLLGTAVSAASAQGQGLPPNAPNVLIIVTDDQRASDTLGVMSQTRRYFKRGGTRYPNAFATTPLCCPSRSSILTGRFAHNTGVLRNDLARKIDVTTMFPRLLNEAGYQTALAGKFLNSWPIATPPPYFDRFAAFDRREYRNPIFNVNGTIKEVGGYSTNVLRTFSLRFLRRFEAKDDDAPWLLYLAPTAPHYPWTPAPRYARAKVKRWSGNPSVFEADRSDKPPYVQSYHFTAEQGRRVHDAQLRTLMSVDDMVSRVFKEMDRLGETRQTLAFFLSDNGFLWADHRLGGAGGMAGQKRVPYTASVKIPFFVRWPGHIRKGAADSRLTGTIDIAPTVLEAAGLAPDPVKPPLDGRSLLHPDERDRILLEFWGRSTERIPTWASIRTHTFQYIEYYDGNGATTFREYYDLRSDGWQLENLLHTAIPPDDPTITNLSALLGQDRVCVGASSCP